jgi:hypothetical protein
MKIITAKGAVLWQRYIFLTSPKMLLIRNFKILQLEINKSKHYYIKSGSNASSGSSSSSTQGIFGGCDWCILSTLRNYCTSCCLTYSTATLTSQSECSWSA